MKPLQIIVEKKVFNDIQSGKVKEYYLAPTNANANLLCRFDKKGNYLGFKPFEVVEFKTGFSDDAPVVAFNIKLIEFDLFENFIPQGMNKGDKAFTIELSTEIVN